MKAAINDNVRRLNVAKITRGDIYWSPDYDAGIAAFLDVVCDDNPYEDVWQPQPETC